MKLSEVSKLLGVPSEPVSISVHRPLTEPLRHEDVGAGTAGGSGRGKASRYIPEDVRQLRLILGLKGLDESLVQQISKEVDWTQDEHTHSISEAVRLVIDLNKYRE